jgi:hypothetical protein
MRMHVPLATLAQLVPPLHGESPIAGQLGEQLGITAPATVTAVDVVGDAVVLHVEGVDPALADAEGWVTAEWTVDAKGRAHFGGFKTIEREPGFISPEDLAAALGAPAPARSDGDAGGTPPAPPKAPRSPKAGS